MNHLDTILKYRENAHDEKYDEGSAHNMAATAAIPRARPNLVSCNGRAFNVDS